MPVFIAALLGGFVSAVGTLVGRVLVSLGIGYVVYQGIDVALQFFKDQTFAYLNAAGSALPHVSQFLGVFQVGTCFNILFSAWASRMVIQGVTSGAVRKMVVKS